MVLKVLNFRDDSRLDVGQTVGKMVFGMISYQIHYFLPQKIREPSHEQQHPITQINVGALSHTAWHNRQIYLYEHPKHTAMQTQEDSRPRSLNSLLCMSKEV
mmetsp:Transcript_30832/g.46774  ORF Transcript_30832/g.46774 Transcript_30832/m.46774 type:complete len:102 (+) Transcript_30832:275-580(+)